MRQIFSLALNQRLAKDCIDDTQKTCSKPINIHPQYLSTILAPLQPRLKQQIHLRQLLRVRRLRHEINHTLCGRQIVRGHGLPAQRERLVHNGISIALHVLPQLVLLQTLPVRLRVPECHLVADEN